MRVLTGTRHIPLQERSTNNTITIQLVGLFAGLLMGTLLISCIALRYHISEYLYLALLLNYLVLVSIGWYEMVQTQRLLNTMSVLCGLFLMYYIVRACYLIGNWQALYTYMWSPTRSYASYDLISALILFGVDFLTLYFGYYLSTRYLSAARARTLEPSFTLRSALVLLVAIIAEIYCLLTGLSNFFTHDPGMLGVILNYVGSFVRIAAIYFLMAWLRKQKRPLLVSCVLLFVFELAIGFLSGWKGGIFVIPLLILIVVNDYRRIRSWQLMVTVIVAFSIGILFVFPTVDVYRERVFAGESPTLTQIAREVFQSANPAILFTKYVHRFLNRFPGIDALVVLTEAYRRGGLEFQYGRTIEGAFTFFIPRSLWPDKPMMDIGYEYAVKLLNQPTWNRNSAAIMDFGELFYNFGWFSPAFALVLGCIYGLVDNLRLSDDVSRLIAYLLLGNGLILIEGNIAQRFVSIVVSCLILRTAMSKKRGGIVRKPPVAYHAKPSFTDGCKPRRGY